MPGVEPPSASVSRFSDPDGREGIALRGRLDSETLGGIWSEALRLVESLRERGPVIDVSDVGHCDGAGASLLSALRRAGGESTELRGLRPETERLIDLVASSPAQSEGAGPEREGFFVRLGRASLGFAAELRGLVIFTGHLFVVLGQALRNPRSIRRHDLLIIAERAGIGAVPIIILVGFLLGLILSFQSAVSLQRFGAQIFVADFLGIAMFRELGPLMAAILLTARSGSAFAAEIGTMKVNEEIDALTTMGLEPVRFLVLPRVLAAILVVPALIMIMNLSGLVGGLVVFLSFDFPVGTFFRRVIEATTTGDLLGGLFKGMVYGVIVAAVGCLRGTQTGSGASAVGDSTTSAVVSGIVLVATASAIFSVVFYTLGI